MVLADLNINQNNKKNKKKSNQNSNTMNNKAQKNDNDNSISLPNSRQNSEQNSVLNNISDKTHKKSNQDLTRQEQVSLNKSSNRDKTATFITEALINLSLQRANSKNSLSKSSNLDLASIDLSKTKSNKKNTKQQQKTNKNSTNNLKTANENSTKKSKIDQNKSLTTISSTTTSNTTPSSISKSNTNSSSNLQVKSKANNNETNKKHDIRARYWSYLFENLKRAVDEIYQTCENDNSISECKEVIAILDNCTNDFRSLISRIQLINNSEKSKFNDKSVAWEVRKSSPKKLTNLNNYNNNKTGELNENQARNLKLESNQEDNRMTGFRDFIPSYENLNISNKKEKIFLNDDYLNVDYDDEEDDYDLDDYDFDNNQKNDSDPIDLLNHETFSDMQSINTDDMSFNTSPPLPSQNFFNMPQTNLNQLSIQMPLFNMNHLQQETWIQPLSIEQPLLLQPNQHLNQQNLLVQNQFDLNHKSHLLNMTTNSLNNSSNSHQLQSNPSYRSDRFTTEYSTILSKPSELSPFNTNTQTVETLNLANKINNNLKNFNNYLLNESFENISIYDDSFRMDKMINNLKQKQNDNYDDFDEENYFGFSNQQVDLLNEEENLEDVDELEKYLKKKNRKLIMNSKENTLNSHHHNILKFYEEEEKNIELELKQDKQLLSVLNEEAKLTRQLSVEQLFHYNHQYQKIKKNSLKTNNQNYEQDENDLITSKLSTDLETNETERNTPLTDYWNKATQSNDWNDLESEMDTTRTPGRAIQVHEKLLSMPRKESPNERRRKHEEKQARAQEKREQFYQERLNKLRELTKKIEQVSELKKKLLRAKKATLKAKLQRAEEKRQYLLRVKATKAATEEQKAQEIAFINNLAAQNRKQDILEKYEKRNEAIRHNLEEERLRKQEEQKAKEHAAELRRKELETQRKTKIKEILEKRQQKQSKIEQTQLEKEKERIETAKAKVKTREMRLAIKEAKFQAHKQQTKKRLIQKHEEWSKRHELNLEEIRKKAIEMSILNYSGEDQIGEAPNPAPYDKPKYCKVCKIIIGSEVQLKSHLRGIKHQQIMNEANQGKNLTQAEVEEYNLNCITDAPKENNENDLILSEERKKLLKKRLKKIKSKLISKGNEYETNNKNTNLTNKYDSNNKSKVPKLVKELEKHLGSSDRVCSNLDRYSCELNRLLQKNTIEQFIFKQNNGLSICLKLLEQICHVSLQQLNTSDSNSITSKSAINLINLLINASKNNSTLCFDLILSNKLLSLLEIINDHSSILLVDINNISDFGSTLNCNLSLKTNSKLQNVWLICSNLFELISSVFNTILNDLQNQSSTILTNSSNVLNEEEENKNSQIDQNVLIQRAIDLVSLITSYGLIDTLSIFFSNIRGPLDDEQQTVDILNSCLNFLISITKILSYKKTVDIFSERKNDDSTQLISTFKTTNLVNIISMLYGMLHKDASTPVKSNQLNNSTSNLNMKKQTLTTLQLTTLSIKLLNQMSVLDLSMVQSLLGEESLSLQLRHIASYLIWYLNTNKCDELLHEIILLIGYFTVLNNENQIKIELGTPPTILQQLCNLSFNYFSDKKLISILYPTLICCCFNNEKNKQVLANELSANMLVNFIEEKLNDDSIKVCNKISEENKFEFDKRFPSKLWQNAINYFSNE